MQTGLPDERGANLISLVQYTCWTKWAGIFRHLFSLPAFDFTSASGHSCLGSRGELCQQSLFSLVSVSWSRMLCVLYPGIRRSVVSIYGFRPLSFNNGEPIYSLALSSRCWRSLQVDFEYSYFLFDYKALIVILWCVQACFLSFANMLCLFRWLAMCSCRRTATSLWGFREIFEDSGESPSRRGVLRRFASTWGAYKWGDHIFPALYVFTSPSAYKWGDHIFPALYAFTSPSVSIPTNMRSFHLSLSICSYAALTSFSFRHIRI